MRLPQGVDVQIVGQSTFALPRTHLLCLTIDLWACARVEWRAVLAVDVLFQLLISGELSWRQGSMHSLSVTDLFEGGRRRQVSILSLDIDILSVKIGGKVSSIHVFPLILEW